MIDQETGQLFAWAVERPLLAPGKGFEEFRHSQCLGACNGCVEDCPFDGCPVLGLYAKPVIEAEEAADARPQLH